MLNLRLSSLLTILLSNRHLLFFISKKRLARVDFRHFGSTIMLYVNYFVRNVCDKLCQKSVIATFNNYLFHILLRTITHHPLRASKTKFCKGKSISRSNKQNINNKLWYVWYYELKLNLRIVSIVIYCAIVKIIWTFSFDFCISNLTCWIKSEKK